MTYSSWVPSVRSQDTSMVSSSPPCEPGGSIDVMGYQTSPLPRRVCIHLTHDAVGSAMPTSTSAPFALTDSSPETGFPGRGRRSATGPAQGTERLSRETLGALQWNGRQLPPDARRRSERPHAHCLPPAPHRRRCRRPERRAPRSSPQPARLGIHRFRSLALPRLNRTHSARRNQARMPSSRRRLVEHRVSPTTSPSRLPMLAAAPWR